MSAGTLIEAPPVAKADINDRIAVNRGGIEWVGWVRALNGDIGALMQWDNGSQSGMLWSEKWRKLPKEEAANPAPPTAPYPTCDSSAAVMVELARIQPFELNPREFRTLPDGSVDPDQHGLRELAESLRLDGQKMPIKVRPLGDGRFGLVDGERRFQAAKLAGFTEIRVEVVICSDEEALADTVVASNHAEPYAIADLARAVRYLLAKDKSQVEVARLLKTNQQGVSMLKRFSQLPGRVQELAKLHPDKLEAGHIRSLVRDHLIRVPKAVIWIAERVVSMGASVRQMECRIPFEDEMPADLRRELRPQPEMELEPETDEPPAPEATPPPGEDRGSAVAALQEQAVSLAREQGHQLGEWKESGTQLVAKCVDCTGTAAIFTADTPMGSAISGTLRAPCQKSTPHRLGVETVPPKPTLPELTAYQNGLRNYPPKAVVREYVSWRDATDPAAYQWRADACRAELDRRSEAGVDQDILKWCGVHGDYECRTCAIARVRSMSEAAGENPEAMLQTNSATATSSGAHDLVTAEPSNIIRPGLGLNPGDVIASTVAGNDCQYELLSQSRGMLWNARVVAGAETGRELEIEPHCGNFALVSRVSAEEDAPSAEMTYGPAANCDFQPATLDDPAPAVEAPGQPVVTSAAPDPAPKPRALKSAEEIAAENASRRTTAPPAPAAPKLPEGWSGQPVQTLIPAPLKASLEGHGTAVIPALNTFCQLAQVAKDHELQASELVGYVARFLAYARWKNKSAEALLSRYEAVMQAEEE